MNKQQSQVHQDREEKRTGFFLMSRPILAIGRKAVNGGPVKATLTA